MVSVRKQMFLDYFLTGVLFLVYGISAYLSTDSLIIRLFMLLSVIAIVIYKLSFTKKEDEQKRKMMSYR